MIRCMWKNACRGMLFLGVLLGSCKNNDFDVGWYLVDDPFTTTGMIDTVTIKVSNLVVSDSVVTSNRGNGFSGVYYDPQIGSIQTQSYIEFARTADIETNRYASFDSVTLVLRPNGEYFGDTVQHAAFKVHRLAKPIEKRDDGKLYSTSTMPLDEQLTDTAIRVKLKNMEQEITDDNKITTKNNNEFEIKLPDSFG